MSEAASQRIEAVGPSAAQPGDMALTANADRVLRARYLQKDESGRCTESPRDLFRRVAKAVADAELLYDPDPVNRSEWEERFFTLMASRRFMPNSPTLMNAGREMGMLSACFVLPVGDSVEEIFDAIKYTALIQKAGGGTGFAFDELRPTGDYIKSSGGTTSGPISFWRAFSEATNAIQQGAFRRGANMGMMYVHHPDILKFLHAKQDLKQFNNYNISIKVTDAWMEGLRDAPNAAHVVVNPRTGRGYVIPKDVGIWDYTIRSLVELEEGADPPPTGDYYTRGDLWDIIVQNAHRTGEPGVVFIDQINAHNPTPHIGRIEATNPCGEQPLLPFEACNLGSVNLARFVRIDDRGEATVNWDELRETIHEATRFLDSVIDVNRYPLPQIEQICKRNRKIGLGIMGFADALYMLEVPYDSEEGIEWGERFMKFVNDEAHNYSEQLAQQRGCFPNWKGSIYDTQFDRKMRNATCTTVAPTGTISIIAGCTGGIEPLFNLVFYRKVLCEQDDGASPMIEINPIFEQVARKRKLLSEGMMERIARDGTLAGIPEVPEDIRRVFVCAHDISPESHIRMQAALQRHCDSAISKTINFPKSATPEDVNKIYQLAYDMKCKGVTVYRDGCRENQPMSLTESRTPKAQDAADAPQRPLEPAILPEITSGMRIRQLTPFGNMHVNITVDPKTEREMEVFAQLGKGGDLANSDLEAICRMVSLWLRSGGRLALVIRQLHGIGSSLQVSTKEGRIMSLGDGLARALQKYTRAKQQHGLRALLLGECDLDEHADSPHAPPAHEDQAVAGGRHGAGGQKRNGNGHQRESKTNGEPSTGAGARRLDVGGIQWQQTQYKVLCPDCHGKLEFSEGCVKCEACGFAEC